LLLRIHCTIEKHQGGVRQAFTIVVALHRAKYGYFHFFATPISCRVQDFENEVRIGDEIEYGEDKISFGVGSMRDSLLSRLYVTTFVLLLSALYYRSKLDDWE